MTVLQGANFVIPLIVLPYLVRTLGAETFGLVMFAQAFILYFNVIVDFGFSLSGVREIAIHRDHHDRLQEIFTSIMFIKLLLLVFSFAVLVTLTATVNKLSQHFMLYLFTFGWVVGQALFPIWFFQGIEKMKYITILKISAQLISLLAIITFVKSQEDYLLVPIFNSLGFIVVGVVSVFMIFRQYQFKIFVPEVNKLKKYFVESSHFFLSRAAVSIYTSSNAFILGLFTNNTLVGYYSIAEKLYIALQALYMPINNVLYPYVSKEKNIALYKKIFKFVLLANTSLIFILYFIAPYLVFLISGEYIPESTKVFRLFLLVSIIIIPSILIGYPFLAALGYKNYANYSVVFASVFHLLGLITLIAFDQVNIYSIVILLLFTQSLDLAIRVYGVKKHHLWNS